MVSSPKGLQSYMDAIFSPEEEQEVDNIYRCFYWLIYMGIPANEALSVRKSEVSIQDMLVRHNGEEIPLYKESVEAFENGISLVQFRTERISKKGKLFTAFIPRSESPYIISTMQRSRGAGLNVGYIMNNIRIRVKRLGNATGLISTRNMYMSGIFYRMLKQEKAGFPVRFDFLLEDGLPPTSEAAQVSQSRYKRDYETWKSSYYDGL